jgi:capsular polysaccharide biosynthesis protein
MDSTQRIIVVLLIMAILFSAASIVVSFSVFSDIDIPKTQISGQVVGGSQGGGGLSLTVTPSVEGGG